MRRAKESGEVFERKRAPAASPEAREDQLIALAEARAEEQLRNGTASAQVICHYLKLGSQRERLEREKLKNEVELMKAKKKAIDSGERIEALYSEAMKAVLRYRGERVEEDD